MIAKNAKFAKQPSYRLRPDYGQAIVTLTDSVTSKRRDYWLGEFDTPASHEMYRRVLAKWESGGGRLFERGEVPKAATEKKTVTEVIHAYKQFVDVSYKRASRQTIYMALRILRQFYGATAAEDFGPNCLRLLRGQMIKGDVTAEPPRKPWSRATINKVVHLIVGMFKWAAGHELLQADIHQRLKTVAALRRGRSEAREPEPVRPVAVEAVEATKPFLNRQLKALVELQLLTGARGDELLRLRAVDLETETAKGVWLIRLLVHKTAHHGHERVIVLGPKAQTIISEFLVGRPLDAFLFNPAEAEQERRADATARRKTPMRQGNSHGTNRVESPKRKPGDRYTSAAYRRAVERACIKAGVPRWRPHQLRHTAATIIRREGGLEAARIALGHSSALITDAIYAERDLKKITEMMRIIG